MSRLVTKVAKCRDFKRINMLQKLPGLVRRLSNADQAFRLLAEAFN